MTTPTINHTDENFDDEFWAFVEQFRTDQATHLDDDGRGGFIENDDTPPAPVANRPYRRPRYADTRKTDRQHAIDESAGRNRHRKHDRPV